MNNQQTMYKKQHTHAVKTLQMLEKQKEEIDFKLNSDPVCSYLHKELRTVNLDIKITLNEIEHVENQITTCLP